ncbi:MAG TPA: hypothetical protein DF613_05225 [Lachnospiraceae bacterium]|nr:hypothetical protein [Lachnospiraceae bacterium]
MKEYRKRFVQLNMLLIGAILLLMVTVIAVYMYRDYYDGLRTSMEQVVEPLDSFSQPPGDKSTSSAVRRPPAGQEAPLIMGNNSQRPERQKDIMTVFYTPEKADVSILSQDSFFDEETLSRVLEAVIAREDSFGTLWNYRTIYYRTGNGYPYKIALASTGYIGHSMLSLVLVLLMIWAGAMLCFLLVSIQFSKVAIRPMEEALRREKQFVADVSHDLKTPLSVILANNSILRENPQATADSLSKWIDSTQNAAKNMQQLIGEMLTLADVERRDSPLTMELVDISEVVMKAALQLESVAYEKNVMLETEIADDITLRANKDYLQRIATGLMENAIKYEPSGGKVRIRLTKIKHRVQLEIQNHNTVIPEDDLSHIFERFYRGDKSRQGGTSGHGLGLSITKQMTERMGGHISADSSHENGTIFSVVFDRNL